MEIRCRFFVVEEADPLKQGLKPSIVNPKPSISLLVEEADPLKQGLKPQAEEQYQDEG